MLNDGSYDVLLLYSLKFYLNLMKNDFKSTLNLLQSTDNRHKSLLSNMRKILSIIKGDRKDAG